MSDEKAGRRSCFSWCDGAEAWISRAKGDFLLGQEAVADGKNVASDISPCACEVQIDCAAAVLIGVRCRFRDGATGVRFPVKMSDDAPGYLRVPPADKIA
jgi:hypothetical protein